MLPLCMGSFMMGTHWHYSSLFSWHHVLVSGFHCFMLFVAYGKVGEMGFAREVFDEMCDTESGEGKWGSTGGGEWRRWWLGGGGRWCDGGGRDGMKDKEDME
ncbi:hypothetical protein Tco_0311431 [Tanacetum coccineum]